jgi:hypothetical protein
MTKLIGLNAEQRCANQFAMVNATTMSAIALSCV